MTRLAIYLQDAHSIPDAIGYVQYAEQRGFGVVHDRHRDLLHRLCDDAEDDDETWRLSVAVLLLGFVMVAGLSLCAINAGFVAGASASGTTSVARTEVGPSTSAGWMPTWNRRRG